MLNIGIVGAENSHTAAIAKVLNVEKRVRGVRVTHVWGETDQYAQAAATAGQIPHIVRTPEELIGQVDAAVVDHRHGKEHLPAARSLLEAKIPLFIDKPFCYRQAEGKALFGSGCGVGRAGLFFFHVAQTGFVPGLCQKDCANSAPFRLWSPQVPATSSRSGAASFFTVFTK